MLISVAAHRVDTEKSIVSIDVSLAEFTKDMDADAVRETLEIIICDDGKCVDIDETDLYIEAERVYQALKNEY